MSEHTPGPWCIAEALRPHRRIGIGSTTRVVVSAIKEGTGVMTLPDARLIAAAPELLEALKACKPLLIPGMNWTDEIGLAIKTMVEAAIAKAEGRT